MKEEDEATHYEDARTGARVGVALSLGLPGTSTGWWTGSMARLAQLEEYRLLERLLQEQCHVGKHQDGRPRDDDDDAGECKVPVALKDPKQVSAVLNRPTGCDLQRPQGEGVRGAGGGDLPRERHPKLIPTWR